MDLLRRIVVLPGILAISGCGSLIRVQEFDLEWQPLHISIGNCPDLTGQYAYELTVLSVHEKTLGTTNTLLEVRAGAYHSYEISNELFEYQTHIEILPSGIDRPRKIGKYVEKFEISQTSNELIETNLFDRTRKITKLDTTMAGCADGAVVFRYFSRWGGADFVSQGMSYGEFEMRKLSDGSLEVTRRARARERSAGLGILGPVKMRPTVTRVYPPAK